MTFTYDPTTDRGRVRLMVPDRVADSALFSDAEIDTFLAIEDGARRATALALETIASDQAMTLKVISLLDLRTDGRAVSQALIARAEKLREQSLLDDASEDGGLFDVAEQTLTDFAFRDRLYKEFLRGG